jgi:Xaa-Pro dipeptidase
MPELELPDVEPDIPFTAEEYRDRLTRLRESMAAAGIDLLLLTSPEAMCWLHGYRSRWYKTASTTSWPPLTLTAVHAEHDRFITFDAEGHETLWRWGSISTDHHWLTTRDLEANLRAIASALRDEGWLRGTVGSERWSPTPNFAVATALEESLESHGCTVVDATHLVRRARHVKSEQELAMVARAAAICDIGHRRLMEVIAPGVTELEAWGEMMLAMAKAGGEHAGLHELVWSGPGLGHGVSSTRAFTRDGPVYADPSGCYYRYHANICRTYWLGDPPAELLRRGNAYAGALEVLCAEAKPGTPVREVNAALRRYYADEGLWDLTRWVGGYELGISFPPDWVGEFVFSADEEYPEGVIEAGTVTNFEHLIEGISMIDTVVYEQQGGRVLSTLPREIIAVGD